MKKKSIAILATIWMMILVAVGSSALTLFFTGNSGRSEAATLSANIFEMAERYARLEEIRETLMAEYYTEIDDETLMTGAIRGMMDSLEDPYTFYYTPEEMQEMEEESEGVYHGVGMLVSMTEEAQLRVVRVFRASPAEKAGVLAGDILLAVDGTPVSGATSKDMNDAVSLIRGEDNSEVIVTILRGEEEMDVPMLRGDVTINYVEYEILEGDIGYMVLYQFMGNCVNGFREAMQAFEDADVSGVIVDVRANPGGRLIDVVAICDELLPEGMIVYTEDRAGSRIPYYSNDEYWDIPMVVLADEASASASEIFAAAMQDYERGIVVGKTTFGKGIVQTLISFRDDGAGMQYTTSSYFTPKGRSIHGEGVTPDVEVELWENYDASITEPDPENDNQLKVAIEELRKLIDAKK